MEIQSQIQVQTTFKKNELQALKELYADTNSILIDLIEFIKHHQNFSDIVDKTIIMSSSVNVPYCYEYLKLSYQVAFQETQSQLNELEESLVIFPGEIADALNYAESDPLSNDAREVINMIKTTFEYYQARFDYIKYVFDINTQKADEAYKVTQKIQPSCGF